ncbi:MAG: MFS transporter [Nakamurella sp.]
MNLAKHTTRSPGLARRWLRRAVEAPLERTVGGPARLRVVVLLACVLGLNTADAATVGAIAPELEAALHISNTGIGLLVTASTGVGAVSTLPLGMLADRINRARMLTVAIVIWSAAMVISGAVPSYPMLLISRLALGVVVGAAAPAVASLIGDMFQPDARGRIYGYVLSGELIGAAVGYLLCGNLAAALSWRFGFWILAPPGLALAWAIHRLLPEPARGGASRIRQGQRHLPTAEQARAQRSARTAESEPGNGDAEAAPLQQEVQAEGIAPHPAPVGRPNPARQSLGWAVRYVLSIRTNTFLIVASSLGYFYFTGLQTFAVVYLQGRFALGQAGASTLFVAIGLGGVVGVLLGGRIADRLIARHHIQARPAVAGVAFGMSAVLLAGGILVPPLGLAVPLLFLAAAALGGANPPLDAARLDIMHSRLWGRAESIRTVLRSSLVAVAPLTFGLLSVAMGGPTASPRTVAPEQGSALGLERTLLSMLVIVVVAAAILLIWARRSYPRDVATAHAFEQATAEDS